MIRVPVLPSSRIFSYPKEAAKAPAVRYVPLHTILTSAWTTDAHTTAYSVDTRPYRLSGEAVLIDGGVTMVLAIFDVDGAGHLGSDAWWISELPKLDALRLASPGPFIYRTRGGYRIVYVLGNPVVLRSREDAQAWKTQYLAWVAALTQRFAIEADPACQDWTRLYRVPHATRTPGGRPEARETLGHPYQIGAWTCEPTDHERVLAQTLAKKAPKRPPREHLQEVRGQAGDGVLYEAFRMRGWLGEAIEAGKWAVRCPWEDQHSKGTAFNTSTVLFAPGAGDTFGWLHCSHAHCQQRDIRDVLRLFSEEEIRGAKREAGITESQICTGYRSPRRQRIRIGVTL